MCQSFIITLITMLIATSTASPTLRLVNSNLVPHHVDHGVGLWIDGVGNVTHDRFSVDRTVSGQSYVSDLQELAQASIQQMQTNGLRYSNGAWGSNGNVQMSTADSYALQLAQQASSGNMNALQQLIQMGSQMGASALMQQLSSIASQVGSNGAGMYSSSAFAQQLAMMASHGINGMYAGNNNMYNGNYNQGNGMYGSDAYAQQMAQMAAIQNSMYGSGAYSQPQMANQNRIYGSDAYAQQLAQMAASQSNIYGSDAYDQQMAQMAASQNNMYDSIAYAQQMAQRAASQNNMYGSDVYAQQMAQIAAQNAMYGQQVGAGNNFNSGYAAAAALMAQQQQQMGGNVAYLDSQMSSIDVISQQQLMAQMGQVTANSAVQGMNQLAQANLAGGNSVNAAQQINQLAQANLAAANALSTQL